MNDLFKRLYFETLFAGYSELLPNPETLYGIYPKEYPDAELYYLNPEPAPQWVEVDIRQILKNRRSRRVWSNQPLERDILSALLLYSAGITGHMPAYGYRRYPLRAFPSAGGLQATELYLGIREGGTDFAPVGVYHYNVIKHGLEKIGADHAYKSMYQAIRATQAVWLQAPPPVIIVLTIDYARLHRKYGYHAARLALVDPGFVAEHFYLVGEALGLAVTAISGFDEFQMFQSLGLSSNKEEYPILALTVGKRILQLQQIPNTDT